MRTASSRHPFLLSAVLVSTLAVPAFAQRDTQFFSCPDTSVFGSGCAADQSDRPMPAPVPVQEAYPLFAPETLARDTPPIFVRALQTLTVEDTDAYLDWFERREAQRMQFEQLLKQRTRARRGQP